MIKTINRPPESPIQDRDPFQGRLDKHPITSIYLSLLNGLLYKCN